MSDPVDLLRRAVRGHDDWPDEGTKAAVIDAARQLIRAIDRRTELIDYTRRNVTPRQEAVAQIIGDM